AWVKQNVRQNYELVELGFQLFDSNASTKEREQTLEKYTSHPLMELAFKRYSNARRPPNNRVSKDDFKSFVNAAWAGKLSSVKHERLKYIVPFYS
ncbi:hypothetical protein EBR96_07890, partial [bacterium]|nr:hypothetical protein [bacterium]